MATYVEKKREAIGFILPPPDPFMQDQDFMVIPNTMRIMAGSGYITNPEKSLKEEIDEQLKLKRILEFQWDTEYTKDQKAARKNLDKLNEYLLACDSANTTHFLAYKPAADWLNQVFLDETEVNELIGLIKKTSSECRKAVDAAIRKELDRLVNFKTLFELIKETSEEF